MGKTGTVIGFRRLLKDHKQSRLVPTKCSSSYLMTRLATSRRGYLNGKESTCTLGTSRCYRSCSHTSNRAYFLRDHFFSRECVSSLFFFFFKQKTAYEITV